MADDPALDQLEVDLSAGMPAEDTPPFREQWVSDGLVNSEEMVIGSLDRDHKMDIVTQSFAHPGAVITVFERRGNKYEPVFTDLAGC